VKLGALPASEPLRIAAFFLVVGSALVLFELNRPQPDAEATLVFWQDHAARHPDFALAHSRLGLAYQAAGRDDLARDAYERALALEPDLEEAAIGLNNALRRSAGRAASLAQLEAYAAAHPDCLVCAYNLAADHLALGALERARPLVERALREGGDASSPSYGERDLRLEALLLAGRYHAARGERASAISYFEAALARDPESRAAKRQLAQLRAQAPLDSQPTDP
jgi:tetratricopeptide (TPR) repeat protein